MCLAGEGHREQYHAGHPHAGHDNASRTHFVGEVSGDRRGGEAGDLQREHPHAHQPGRVAHFVGQIHRQKGEQRRLRHVAEGRTEQQHVDAAVGHQAFQTLHVVGQALRFAAVFGKIILAAGLGDAQRAQEGEDDHRHDHAGHHVDHDDLAPGQCHQQRADHQRRERIADIGPHAVYRQHQPLALRIAARQGRNGGRMPQVIADPHQHHADEQHRIVVREADQEIGHADPEQRNRQEQRFLAHGVDDHAAGNVGYRTGKCLAGHHQADLAVGQAQFLADQRQQDIKSCRIPVRQRVADGDDPDFLHGSCRGLLVGGGDRCSVHANPQLNRKDSQL